MKQKGFILITSLIFLAIMTMIGVSMFGGFSTDAQMSGNYREKSRAREAAQTALNSAADWLSKDKNAYSGAWNTGAACTTTGSTPTICSNALATPITPSSWTSYVTYTPSGMQLNTAGGLKTYASTPNYYIQYLGQKSATEALYLTTASAAGGNAASVSVLRTVYSVTFQSGDLGAP